jgi:ligand-binding sensor domain-containing protein/signal transduction histidine kinase
LNELASILLLTLLQLISLAVAGQQSIFKTYTVGDGLVNNSVRRIFQDSKGFLWIATWEGLSKYDGNRFTNFTESNGLSHNLVNDVVELPSGDIYVAMNNGTIDLIKEDRIAKARQFNNIIVNRFQFDRTGRLFASTDTAGIAEVRGGKITSLNKANGASCYGVVNLNDSLMAAATDTLLAEIFDKQFRIWSTVPKGINGGVSLCVYKDLQNRLWIGTTKGLKLVAINYVKHQMNLVNPPAPFDDPLITQGYVSCMFQEKNGNFWVGTAQGLIYISKEGQLKQFNEQDGLPSRFVSYIFPDRENNLWIGTDLGLTKLIAPARTTVTQLFQGQPHVASIIQRISSNEMLVAMDQLLYRYNFQTGKNEDILRLLRDKNLMYVTNSSPALFIYGNELYHYDIRSNQLIAPEKMTGTVNFSTSNSATTTDQHTIFIPIARAIVVYANGRTFIDSTFKMRINNILADKKGYVWLGTWDDGLYRAKYDPANQKWTEITHFTQLPDNHIRTLFQDKQDNMWAGTRYNGVVRIAQNGSENKIVHLNQQNGLQSNWIVDMTEDRDGNIWVVSRFGIDKLIKTSDGFSLFNYSRIINFFPNVNLIEYANGNTLFCSSLQGLCEIRDDKLEQTTPQQVYLTKIVLAGPGKSALTFTNAPQKVVLPHSTNNALFEFTAPTYLNERQILYSYRLKGSNDTAWSHPSNIHSVQYASLAPGHYQFEVRMLGWNGQYGAVTSFLFIVKTPYWKTWWFYTLIAALVFLGLYRLYRYRIDQLMRVQKVRNTIATDLHDDIGSTLTNISILSELSKKNLEQPQAAEQLLQRITEESVASQQALDDIIWSVNSRNDNMQELQARMRRYAAELFEGDNMQCEVSFDNKESSRLNMEQRRDLYLVFKECLNNIRKHAGAKNVSIKIAVKDGVLNMQIQDDGRGFNQDVLTDRNGLQNMRMRVTKWNGDLKINSSPGGGTRIEISMLVKTSLLK